LTSMGDLLRLTIDIRLSNALVKSSLAVSKLSISQFRQRFGDPELVPVSRVDGGVLPEGTPANIIVPCHLGRWAKDFTPEDARALVLCDFGEAFRPNQEPRLGRDCNTPMANRCPEAVFEPHQRLSYSSDIWSLAIALWDLLGMRVIFSDSEGPSEIIAEHIDALGMQVFPAKWLDLWNSARTASSDPLIPRRSKGIRNAWPPPLEKAFEEFVQAHRKKRPHLGLIGAEEAHVFLDMVRRMLTFDPEERLTTRQVLETEWMIKWALPELEKK